MSVDAKPPLDAQATIRDQAWGTGDGRVPTEIVIVRHGQTEWSESGPHTGLTDLPLAAAGRQQARALRAVLADRTFSLVLCSPLRRARETCELAGFGERAVLCDDVREWDYGEYEGLTTDEIRPRASRSRLQRSRRSAGSARPRWSSAGTARAARSKRAERQGA